MRWQSLLASAAIVVSSVRAVFTDDAFHIDYHQALLGIPLPHETFFYQPQSSSNASLLYTISDKSVIGAINPRDGSLVWRQSLANLASDTEQSPLLVPGQGYGRVTSGVGSTVSAWDASDGRLNWAYNFDRGSTVRALQAVPFQGGAAEDMVYDVVALAGPTQDGIAAKVIRLGGNDIGARWEYQDTSAGSDTSFALAVTLKYVYYITKTAGILSGGKAKVVVLDIVTGAEVKQYTVATDSDTLNGESSHVVSHGLDAAFMVSSEKPFKSIKVNLLGSAKSVSVTIDDKGEQIQKLTYHCSAGVGPNPALLVHVKGKTREWAEVFSVNSKTGEVTKVYSLPATAEISTFSTTSLDSKVFFTRVTEGELSLYSSESHGRLGNWPRPLHSSQGPQQYLHAATEVSARGAGGYAVRVALTSAETGLSLTRNGEESWSRPEMLAYIDKAVWAETVDTEPLVQEIKAEASSNPLTAYVHRLTRHVSDLQHLPAYLLSLPESFAQSGNSQGLTTRERLVGSKLVLASTSKREIFALDATNKGTVVWRTDLTKLAGSDTKVVHLSVQEGRLTVYLSTGMFVVVEIATGNILKHLKATDSFSKLIELPGSPASTIVKVSDDGKPEVFSALAPTVPTEGSILVTVNDKGEATGWSVGSSIEEIWTLRPKTGSAIQDVIARPTHDPVASIGKVLGDRSVLYKYISPNVALLTAISSTALTVYLINAVTGSILHTATHEGVLQDLPVSAVASGNWFAYSFTTQDSASAGLSTQIVVNELYESASPNNRGPLSTKASYSSFAADAGAKPHVKTIAFTVAEPLSNLTVTQTTQGITTRQMLAYLPNSESIVGLPLDLLNARRPVDRDPTANEIEEGLFKYAPILDLEPKLFVSHSREVIGIETIITAPTLLESTSLVFAYGHDIFGTQVSPSNTFDVLGKGFKRVQLVLTVVALYGGVLFLRPLVRKKMVETRWA